MTCWSSEEGLEAWPALKKVFYDESIKHMLSKYVVKSSCLVDSLCALLSYRTT